MHKSPPRSPDPLFVLRGSKGAVNCVNVLPLNDDTKGQLVSGCGCGEVRVWSLTTRRPEIILDGHSGKGVLFVEAINRSNLISQGRDGNILTWDIGEGRRKVLSTIAVSGLTFCKCNIYQQGSPLVAAPGLDSEVQVIDLCSQKTMCTLKADKDVKSFGMPMCLTFVSESKLLAGYEAGKVVLWDICAGKILMNKQLHSEPVMCLGYSTSSKRGVSGSADDKLMSWTIGDIEISQSDASTLTNPGLSDVSIRSDEKILATAGWDTRIRIFGWKRLKPLAVLNYHKDTVHSVVFTPPQPHFNSAQLLAAGSKDKHISLWSVYNPG